ncbi:plastocyanin/azurin family copper-binding protein [Streptomyces sp. NPDC047043]|uniref:cupredoxin domain-containing protein n=1 Tax=Streptomyces sp. NPDC047043 TaxID=3154497 RepID=UPI0033FA6B14
MTVQPLSRPAASAGYALVTLAALVGCASADGGSARGPRPSAPPAALVLVRDVAFTPATVRVGVGQSVRWTFDDGGLLHGVSSDGGARQEFDSGIHGKCTFTVIFHTAGTFDYHCEVHSMMMTGTVVVSPSETARTP